MTYHKITIIVAIQIIFPVLTFAQENPLHTWELVFHIRNSAALEFTATAQSNIRWDEDLLLTQSYSSGTTTTSSVETGLDFVAVIPTYSDVLAYDLYRIQASETNALFYIDYRDSRYEQPEQPNNYGGDVNIYYDGSTQEFRLGGWTGQLLNNQTKGIWEIFNKGTPSTNAFQPTDPSNLLITTYNNHPKLTWTRSVQPASAKYHVFRATYKLGPYSQVTPSALSDSFFVDNQVLIGGSSWMYYRVRAISGDGSKWSINYSNLRSVYAYERAKASHPIVAIPDHCELGTNFPNLFNPSTTIFYSLAESRYVELSIFNMLGQEVAKAVNEFQTAGFKSVTFDASHLPCGVYYYRLTAGNFVEVKKMLQIK